jgi:purine-binding chemotaxis protein CheW
MLNLRPEITAARIVDSRTRQLAARRGRDTEPAPPGEALLICALGAENYGIPISAVLRVVPFAPCTPAPGAPPAMLGFFGRAGQVFIVLDLGIALGLAGSPGGITAPEGHLLLLRHGPRRFALRVDRALGAVAGLQAGDAATAAPHRAVIGHGLAPAGLAGPTAMLVGLIDPERLLRPFLANAAPASTASNSPGPSPLGSIVAASPGPASPDPASPAAASTDPSSTDPSSNDPSSNDPSSNDPSSTGPATGA